MNRHGWLGAVVVALLASLGGWASAQSRPTVPITPTVLSGDNIGFRVEG